MTIYACSFLEKDFPHIAWYSKTAEYLITLDLAPQAIKEIGTVTEMISKKICVLEGLPDLIKTPEGKHVSQNSRINSLHYDEKIINKNIFYDFKDIVNLRNLLTHPEEEAPIKDYSKKAKSMHKKLYRIASWFCISYGCKCNVKDETYPGIIFKKEEKEHDIPEQKSRIIVKSASKSLRKNKRNEEYNENAPPITLNDCLTDFSKVECEDIILLPNKSNVDRLHYLELKQDINRLKKLSAESDDVTQLANVVKAMNNELKSYSKIKTLVFPAIKEIEHLEKELSYDKPNINKIVLKIDQISKYLN